MFTESQIKEINSQLARLGIKDSQFKETNTLTGDEEIVIVQDNLNKRISLFDLIKYLDSNIDIEDTQPESIYYEINIKTNPSDAKVIINGEEINKRVFKSGTRVSIVITKDGYESITDSLVLIENKSLFYNLIAITHNFKLLPYYFNNPMPNNSNFEIYINNVKYSPSGGHYFVDTDFPENTVINYSVSFGSPYYTKEEGSFVLTEDTIKEVHIYSNDVFTITESDYFKIDRISNEAQQIKLTWYYGVKPDDSIDDSVDINSPYTIDVTDKVTMNDSNVKDWLSWNKETGMLTVEQNTTGKSRSLFVTFNYESKGMSSGLNIVQLG